MPATRIGFVQKQSTRASIGGMGLFPGPPGGDAWQAISQVDTSRLVAGRQYAFILTGKIGNVRVNGANPSRGVIQLALGQGTTPATINPLHVWRMAASEFYGPDESIPFQFLALVCTPNAGGADPTWGAWWANSGPLRLWARTWFNGDPTNYSVDFDVADMIWIVLDLTAQPSAEWRVEQHLGIGGAQIVPGTLYSHMLSGGFGSGTGQRWLHFAHLDYRPGWRYPRFLWGSTTTGAGGITTRVGTEWWGKEASSPPSLTAPVWQMGCMWWDQVTSGNLQISLRGTDLNSSLPGSVPTVVDRVAFVSLLLDNLPDVLLGADVVVDNLASPIARLNQTFWAMEQPGAGAVSIPTVFFHAIAATREQRNHGLHITTQSGRVLSVPAIDVRSQPLQRASLFDAVEQGLSRTQPEVQYRNHVLGRSLPASGPRDPARDLWWAQLYLVRNPDRVPYATPAIGTPVVVVPGREGADVSTLPDPPTAPNAPMEESAEGRQRVAIEGVTGYRRRWPIFVQTRRIFPLTWGPIDASEADALMAFLVSTPIFRITPNGATAPIAVAAVERPQRTQGAGQVFTVQLRVAELIWTG